MEEATRLSVVWAVIAESTRAHESKWVIAMFGHRCQPTAATSDVTITSMPF